MQHVEKNLATTVEVFQIPTPAKDMLEVVDDLAACLDEFKDRVHRQRLQGEGERH
jgi:hypothetical protein